MFGKHKKDASCPGCYPDRDFRGVKQARDRKLGGYRPLPRCPAHAITNLKPPRGPAPGMGR